MTIAAPTRRIDMALPEYASVAELLPGLLARAGEGLADEGVAGGGWQLRRPDGTTFDLGRTLGAHRVRDGEILHLVTSRADWPEPEYDDVVDAIATGAGRTGSAWAPRHTRLAGLSAGTATMLLGLVAVLRAGPGWTTPAVWALVVAGVLLAAGVVLARAVGDAGAGAVLAGAALPFAFVGGGLLLAGAHALSSLAAGHLMLAGVALLLTALAGYLGVAAAQTLFAGAAATGLFALLAGFVAAVSDLAAYQTAAAVAAALLALSIVFAPLALRLGKVPMPVLPRSTADLVRDDPQPPIERVHAAVARADGLLTGMLGGASVVVMYCQMLLTHDGSASSVTMVAVLAAGFLLRARLYPTPRQRIPLLVTGMFGAACLVAGPFTDGTVPLVAVVAALLAVAAALMVAGILLSTRAANPYFGRFGEYSEILLLAALVPVVCWVLGLYGYVRGLGG
ncbi:type VII secretion integral membrane protein EccD [Amycolatopsis rhizosphaerae]|uniref:type VII secretion integral membrane protein EccD n=1 Tax=Amycolatopsis rhizosphaerae TaxID=2053003 RepID=UPI001FE68CC3|nr:type VII secretion integral membrane protein EccD [Amycolatopsis rhizosphaerae]